MADPRDRKQALDDHRAKADAFEKRGDWANAVREREAAYAIASGQGNRVRLVDALARAGSTDPEDIRDAIEQTSGLAGTTGVVTMTPEDHLGFDLSAFQMLEIENDNWTLVQ